MASVKVENLWPGAVVLHSVGDDTVRVEIQGERKTWTDRFGVERLRYWACRQDTEQQGWMRFGYGALVHVADAEK